MSDALVHEPELDAPHVPARDTGWSGVQWFFVLGWPILIVAMGLFVVAPRVLGVRSLDSALAARAPIAVVDVQKGIGKHLGAGSTDADFKAGKAEVDDLARRLARAGYIVLDSSNVYAYPARYEASP